METSIAAQASPISCVMAGERGGKSFLPEDDVGLYEHEGQRQSTEKLLETIRELDHASHYKSNM